jgi:hypothetical protein
MPSSPKGPVLALLASSVLWGLIWLPLKFFAGIGFGSVSLLLVAYGSLSVFGVPLMVRTYPHCGRPGARWQAYSCWAAMQTLPSIPA